MSNPATTNGYTNSGFKAYKEELNALLLLKFKNDDYLQMMKLLLFGF